MPSVAILAPSWIAQRFNAFQVPVWAAVLLLLALCFVIFILWKSRQD